MSFLVRSVMTGASFACLALIGCGVYGIFAGDVLPPATIAKVMGTAALVGLVAGAAQ